MINELRNQIDAIDNQIIELLDVRFDCSKAIGEEKKKTNTQVLDSTREQAILNKVDEIANPEHAKYIKQVYVKLMEQSREYQKDNG